MIKKSLVLITLAVLASCGRTATPTSDSSVTSTGADTAVVATSTVGDMIARDEGYAQCIENARFTCGNNFITSYAQNNSSTDICEQFGDETLRTACKDMVITETAKKTLDSDRCSSLSDTDKRAMCKQNVIMAKGVKNADPTVCSNYELASTDVDTLDNMKNRCVIHIIDQLEPNEKTKGLCGLITDADLVKSCEEKIQLYIDAAAPAPAPIE